MVSKIIQSYELKRISISKYALGLEATGLTQDYQGEIDIIFSQ